MNKLKNYKTKAFIFDLNKISSIIALMVVFNICFTPLQAQSTVDWQAIEPLLEQYRQHLKIPGMSAGVVQNGRLVWSKGFGYADVQRKIKATPQTIFHIASLTKTFTAAIFLKLEQEGKLKLTDSLAKYGIKKPKLRYLQIRHVLSHVSDSKPVGSAYKYNSPRFELLGKVLKKATGKSFAQLVMHHIANPLQMKSTAPNINARKDFLASGRNWYAFKKQLATPYRLKNGNPTKFVYSHRFNTSVGMMSNIPDLAKYAQALEGEQFLSKAQKKRLFQPWITPKNDTLPYAKGWFVQCYQGVELYWHYGYGRSCSSLILKVPDKKLTILVLANADLLSEPFSAGLGVFGDVTSSPIANIFLRKLVFAHQTLPEVNYINNTPQDIKTQWLATQNTAFAKMYKNELVANVLLAKSTKRYAQFDALFRWYLQVIYPVYTPDVSQWKSYIGQYPVNRYYVFKIVQNNHHLYYKTPESRGTGLKLYPVGADKFLLDPYTRIIFRDNQLIIQNDWDEVKVKKQQ